MVKPQIKSKKNSKIFLHHIEKAQGDNDLPLDEPKTPSLMRLNNKKIIIQNSNFQHTY